MPLDQPPSVPSPNPQLQKPVVVGLEKQPQSTLAQPVIQNVPKIPDIQVEKPSKPSVVPIQNESDKILAEMQRNKPEDYFGIPLESFKHFNIPLEGVSGKELNQLRDIVQWAKTMNPLNPMGHISALQREIGMSNADERYYEKVWRYVKMQEIIYRINKGQ